ncbi:FecCD family ABC transporter permease [Kiloniella sp. b19]|uniref:FecCD family ABC transporter permease n=1 Tax=Kiloniella sp. GXU_MW_B19 TaxID=3141326 RepID=UPI0031D5F947
MRFKAITSLFSRSNGWLILMILTLFLVAGTASLIGAINILPGDILTSGFTPQQEAILTTIRLPRVFLAAITGAALAVSGAAMQGLFRNPLADPGLIGIAGGAALAVGLVIVILGPIGGLAGLYSLGIAAFAGGLSTSLLIFYLVRKAGGFSVTTMLLAGIAINAITAAATGFLTFLSNDQQLRALTFWTMGNLGGALWPAVLVALSVVLPATVLLARSAQQLNILMLGEAEAEHLGVNTKALKYRIVFCTALAVGIAVAVSGIIGFVGLIVPHLIRLLFGPDHRFLIPASALGGAILLVIADTLARTVVIPAEIPVGILTSLIGGPFFLFLLIRQFRGMISL